MTSHMANYLAVLIHGTTLYHHGAKGHSYLCYSACCQCQFEISFTVVLCQASSPYTLFQSWYPDRIEAPMHDSWLRVDHDTNNFWLCIRRFLGWLDFPSVTHPDSDFTSSGIPEFGFHSIVSSICVSNHFSFTDCTYYLSVFVTLGHSDYHQHLSNILLTGLFPEFLSVLLSVFNSFAHSHPSTQSWHLSRLH